jgi:hypothetical protein
MPKTLFAAASLAAFLLLPSPARAIDRPPMKSRRDLEAAGGLGRAAPELRFARCTKPGNGDELFETIRFGFGS